MRKICPIKNKLETNRMLRALGIAEVLFWHEGYHTQYLQQIEDFIRRKRMYSPRISEEFIPKLYQLSRLKKIPMTKLVNKIVEKYLEKNMEKQEDQNKAVVSENN